MTLSENLRDIFAIIQNITVIHRNMNWLYFSQKFHFELDCTIDRNLHEINV